MKVIIPCCGWSKRFPNTRPKWMLTAPDGNLMIKKAVEQINVDPKDIVVTILKKHEDQYDIIRGIKENIGKDVTVVVLKEQTNSQPETIVKTIDALNLNEPFLIKDSDNTFEVKKISEEFNYVCYSDLQHYEDINPGNKSYIKMNEQNIIIETAEKKVISRHFNLGGYYFMNPNDYVNSYNKLMKQNNNGEIFTSHIIQDMILGDGKIFFGKKVAEYIDWGTEVQWQKYRQKYKSFIIDIDGVIFKSSAEFFKPRWPEAEPNNSNIEAIKKLCDNPKTQVFFMTSRNEKYREITEKMLNKFGLKHNGMIMGALHANRFIINDFSASTKYPTCQAINILRDSEDLEKYI